MLKVRIMPTLLFRDMGLVKGISFNSWRMIGSAMQAIKVYNMREVDELVFLDISATLNNRRPDFETIDDLADECFMPMTVGGGVRTVDDARRLLQVGADKVAINSAAVENPGLIRDMANRFGSQCVVVSIDFKKTGNAEHRVFTHSGTRPTAMDPVDFARQAEEHGAGEILLTSVDRDGTMTGYDIEVTARVSEALTIPIIASGGAGNYEHMLQVLTEGKAAAIAAASIFHFTQQTPLEAKHYLYDRNIRVRL